MVLLQAGADGTSGQAALKLEDLFKDIYLGEDVGEGGAAATGGAPPAAVPDLTVPAPPAGAAGKVRQAGDKALQRATAEAAVPAGGAPARLPLTARNLVLKEKVERKAEGQRGTARGAGDPPAVDDEELRAIAGTSLLMCTRCAPRAACSGGHRCRPPRLVVERPGG